VAKQSKSGSPAKRRKEYTGGGAWGGRFSHRELERELHERRESQGLAESLEPDTDDGGRVALGWVVASVLVWVVLLVGVALVALR